MTYCHAQKWNKKFLNKMDRTSNREETLIKWRNLVSFWLFGLTNNFAYVIMLSAAHDILRETANKDDDQVKYELTHKDNNTKARDCNELSTGAVLLADIIPTLIVKLSAPFFMQSIPYGIRIFLVVLSQTASYLIVSYSYNLYLSLFGVVCASFGSGLGEISFLSFASHFDRDTISTWASGTGAAGLFGALAYAGLTEPNLANLSPRVTVLVMIVTPVMMAFSYWLLLYKPSTIYQITLLDPRTWWISREAGRLQHAESAASLLAMGQALSIRTKLGLIRPLLMYMIPLGLVYVGEYFINQGLQELIYFRGIWLTHESQYRWFQVLYQLGVFISRSSVNVIQIKSALLPLLPILQFGNAAFFFFEALYLFTPSIWIMFALTVWEGLLGGAAYVNTFYQIRQEVDPRYVEYSLGVASVADSSGIVLAGFSAIPVHNWICHQPLSGRYY